MSTPLLDGIRKEAVRGRINYRRKLKERRRRGKNTVLSGAIVGSYGPSAHHAKPGMYIRNKPSRGLMPGGRKSRQNQ